MTMTVSKSVRMPAEDVTRVEEFQRALADKEMMNVSFSTAVVRLVRIGLRESTRTTRRAGK
jgi:hypothetical protein